MGRAREMVRVFREPLAVTGARVYLGEKLVAPAVQLAVALWALVLVDWMLFGWVSGPLASGAPPEAEAKMEDLGRFLGVVTWALMVGACLAVMWVGVVWVRSLAAMRAFAGLGVRVREAMLRALVEEEAADERRLRARIADAVREIPDDQWDMGLSKMSDRRLRRKLGLE